MTSVAGFLDSGLLVWVGKWTSFANKMWPATQHPRPLGEGRGKSHVFPMDPSPLPTCCDFLLPWRCKGQIPPSLFPVVPLRCLVISVQVVRLFPHGGRVWLHHICSSHFNWCPDWFVFDKGHNFLKKERWLTTRVPIIRYFLIQYINFPGLSEETNSHLCVKLDPCHDLYFPHSHGKAVCSCECYPNGWVPAFILCHHLTGWSSVTVTISPRSRKAGNTTGWKGQRQHWTPAFLINSA